MACAFSFVHFHVGGYVNSFLLVVGHTMPFILSMYVSVHVHVYIHSYVII